MNPIEILVECSGEWQGSNTLHDPNTGQPEVSPSTMNVVPVLDGRFVRLDYTWSYQGKPQAGSLLVGFDPGSGLAWGHWIDTWHLGSLGLDCQGGILVDGTIAVTGSYAAPPGPDWGWRIEVATEPLRITHTNIFPDNHEERAALSVYARGRRVASATRDSCV